MIQKPIYQVKYLRKPKSVVIYKKIHYNDTKITSGFYTKKQTGGLMSPLNLLIKPVSGSCNMNCSYCFYTDEIQHREIACTGKMNDELMHKLIDQAFEYADSQCTFAFQGGEPSLAGLQFYKDFSDYVENHSNPRNIAIHYAFQTNGLLIDDAWASWFKKHQVLVGISLDGPKSIHDRYRKDHLGQGTFDKVMSTIDILNAHQVDYNILCVVHAASAYKARKIYEFYRKNNMNYHQYIECLDPLESQRGIHEYSLKPSQYETFLKELFDAWYEDMTSGHYVYNRYFENLMMILLGQGPESCNMRGFCGPQWVIEADGSVYPCDFYVLDEWKLGNIMQDSFDTMEKNREISGFIQKSHPIPDECKQCKWLMLCRNGCRRNRMIHEDSLGKNYFCTAYKNFLEYASPRFMVLYQMLKNKKTF